MGSLKNKYLSIIKLIKITPENIYIHKDAYKRGITGVNTKPFKNSIRYIKADLVNRYTINIVINNEKEGNKLPSSYIIETKQIKNK